MTVFAFAGPSLPPADRVDFPGVTWLPPCEAGDLLRLAPHAGDILCVIDGWFDHRPAIRHKELLWALSKGVRVLGASSIGALRAAEMAPFGMIGVGRIFRAYAAGRLTGDDEVALVHAPAQWGWRPLSVPLVDVRATLCLALRSRRLDVDTARRIRHAAAATHYVDRTWPVILASAEIPPKRRDALLDWTGRFAVEQKRLDARACIEAALRPITSPPAPVAAVRTVFLAELARQCGVTLDPADPAPGP